MSVPTTGSGAATADGVEASSTADTALPIVTSVSPTATSPGSAAEIKAAVVSI